MSQTFARFAALQHAQRAAFEQLVELSLRHARQSGSIGAQFIAAIAEQQQQALRKLTDASDPAAFTASQFALVQWVAKDALPRAQQFYDTWLKTQTEAAGIAIGVAVSAFAPDDDVATQAREAARPGETVVLVVDPVAQPAAAAPASEAQGRPADDSAPTSTDDATNDASAASAASAASVVDAASGTAESPAPVAPPQTPQSALSPAAPAPRKSGSTKVPGKAAAETSDKSIAETPDKTIAETPHKKVVAKVPSKAAARRDAAVSRRTAASRTSRTKH
jgi:phasin family protein